MAIIDSSSPWFGARGSIGGVTFQTSNGITQIHTRKRKLQTPRFNSGYKLQKFNYFQQQYRVLSLSDKADWQNVAISETFVDKFGNSKSIQAINWFTWVNSINSSWSGSLFLNSWTSSPVSQLSNLNCFNAFPVLQINFDLYTETETTYCLIFASDIVPRGSAINLNSMRYIFYIVPNGLTSYDLTTGWEIAYNKTFSSNVASANNTVNISTFCFSIANPTPLGYVNTQFTQ